MLQGKRHAADHQPHQRDHQRRTAAHKGSPDVGDTCSAQRGGAGCSSGGRPAAGSPGAAQALDDRLGRDQRPQQQRPPAAAGQGPMAQRHEAAAGAGAGTSMGALTKLQAQRSLRIQERLSAQHGQPAPQRQRLAPQEAQADQLQPPAQRDLPAARAPAHVPQQRQERRESGAMGGGPAPPQACVSTSRLHGLHTRPPSRSSCARAPAASNARGRPAPGGGPSCAARPPAPHTADAAAAAPAVPAAAAAGGRRAPCLAVQGLALALAPAQAMEGGDAAAHPTRRQAQQQRPQEQAVVATHSSEAPPRRRLAARPDDRLGCGRLWLEAASSGSAAAAACHQWRWFASRARRRRAAALQRARRLQLPALAALMGSAAGARARRRQALLLGCKRQFMLLASCFEAWAQRSAQRRRMAELELAFARRRCGVWGDGPAMATGWLCAAGWLGHRKHLNTWQSPSVALLHKG